MDSNAGPRGEKRLGRWVSAAIVMAALALGLAVLYHVNHHPNG